MEKGLADYDKFMWRDLICVSEGYRLVYYRLVNQNIEAGPMVWSLVPNDKTIKTFRDCQAKAEHFPDYLI